MAKDNAGREHFLHHRKFYWTVIVQTTPELSFWIVVPDYTHTHTLTSSPHTPFFSSYRGVKVKVVPGSMGYTVHGILQARILKWVAFPFSRGSFQPRGQTQVSGIAGGSFPRCGGWEYEHASQCHSAVERRSSLVPTVSHTLWASRRQLWRQSMLTAF